MRCQTTKSMRDGRMPTSEMNKSQTRDGGCATAKKEILNCTPQNLAIETRNLSQEPASQGTEGVRNTTAHHMFDISVWMTTNCNLNPNPDTHHYFIT